MTDIDLDAIEARIAAIGVTGDPWTDTLLATDIPTLLSALRDRDATIARVRDFLDSAAIYRPDHEAYGDDAWDNIETVNLEPFRAALDPQKGEADAKFLHTSTERVKTEAETSHVDPQEES